MPSKLLLSTLATCALIFGGSAYARDDGHAHADDKAHAHCDPAKDKDCKDEHAKGDAHGEYKKGEDHKGHHGETQAK